MLPVFLVLTLNDLEHTFYLDRSVLIAQTIKHIQNGLNKTVLHVTQPKPAS